MADSCWREHHLDLPATQNEPSWRWYYHFQQVPRARCRCPQSFAFAGYCLYFARWSLTWIAHNLWRCLQALLPTYSFELALARAARIDFVLGAFELTKVELELPSGSGPGTELAFEFEIRIGIGIAALAIARMERQLRRRQLESTRLTLAVVKPVSTGDFARPVRRMQMIRMAISIVVGRKQSSLSVKVPPDLLELALGCL